MEINRAGVEALAILALIVVSERKQLPVVQAESMQRARDFIAQLERAGNIVVTPTFSREDVRSWVKPEGGG